MTSVGNHVTSYDTGSKPFKHDDTRGKWSSTGNFVLACIGHAFGLTNFSVLPVFIMMHGGVFFIIPYTIGLLVFALPVFFIQSFLGQFSSTGFISVFRISPLFKGIGYVILLLNITSASFFAVAAAYPLVYFFISFSIDLPWMSCNHTWNSQNCTEKFINTTDEYGWYDLSWSTAEFFEIGILNQSSELKVVWPVFICTMAIWAIAGLVLYNGIQLLEKVMAMAVKVIFTLLGILFIRFCFLPGSGKHILQFLEPSLEGISHLSSWIGSPYISVLLLGPGWGSILTFASYNHFKTDITKSSLTVCLAVLPATILTALGISLANNYLSDYHNFVFSALDKEYVHTYLFIGFPYLFSQMEASQMWAMMFYAALFLAELLTVIFQLFIILTAIFDEFEPIRSRKKEACIGLPVFLAIASIIFTTNQGIDFLSIFESSAGFSKMGLCFLELMVVVWVYGRVRFQRDLGFMLNRSFPSWLFQFIRFVPPFFALVVMLIFLAVTLGPVPYSMIPTALLLLGIKVSPWILIPAYIVYKLYSTTGPWIVRLKRCVRPNDWGPAYPSDRQKYEELISSAEISHHLIDKNEPDEEEVY